MKHIKSLLLIFVLAISAVPVLIVRANAGSDSVALEKAKLALLDGGESAPGQILAGLAIQLDQNVKTYWRMPGDSGLPPVFDFSASRNVAHVEIAWPAPERFVDGDGTILGYKNRVIFPFIVTPQNPEKPVTLALTIDFGLCETLCLPAKATLSRDLASGGAARSSIESFLARVPKQATINSDMSPSVLSVQSQEGSPASLDLSIRSGSTLKDAIIEGPENWYFGRAEIAQTDDGAYRVIIPVEQKPTSTKFGGLGLTVTLIAKDGATETRIKLNDFGSIR